MTSLIGVTFKESFLIPRPYRSRSRCTRFSFPFITSPHIILEAMCGILFTSKRIVDLEATIRFLKKRGPDHTEHREIQGYQFVHVLLSMTGKDFTIQPFEYGGIVIMFNGEIYNYKDFGDFNSDGECIIESYRRHGPDFARHLDGEFTIAIADFDKDVMYYTTDVFSTKPLWWAQEGKEIGLCSYESSLKHLGFKEPKQVPANTTIALKLSDRTILGKNSVYDFDLRQHKTSFDDWNSAFEESIRKRTRGLKHKIFIGLSGGYDSGLIACVLTKLGIPFTAYTILGSETPALIKARHTRLLDGIALDIPQSGFLAQHAYLKKYSEEYLLSIDNGEGRKLASYTEQFAQTKSPEERQSIMTAQARLRKSFTQRLSTQKVTEDNGSIGMSYLCSLAHPAGQRIYLSGSGADETISDYGFKGIRHYGHSTIGGLFPDDLKTIFPWKNFFGNTQRAYLMKEETVTGTWGIEGRYPFLDKQVVQEYLWLTSALKNAQYKSVIHNYLVTHNYPFEKEQKVGFNCGFQGAGTGYKPRTGGHLQIDRTPVGIPKGGRKDLIVKR